MSAIISDCGQYRYRLTRSLPSLLAWKATVCFIMLNPSTADANVDDPTIRRCMGFATDWGYAELVVVNLFAYRATDPKELGRVADPVGPDNVAYVRAAICEADRVVCAWGAIPKARMPEARRVAFMMARYNIHGTCLGKTKDGHPRHPLYVPKTKRLEGPYP